MQFSGAAVPVAYQCWVLPCVHLWCFKVHCLLWISLCNPLLPCVQGHTVVWSPSPFHSLKKPNKLKKTPSPPKKTERNTSHLNLSNHTGFVGMFLTAITETLESAPERQKLLSLAPRSNQIGVYFIASINFLWTVLEVCEEERRRREEKNCSGM